MGKYTHNKSEPVSHRGTLRSQDSEYLKEATQAGQVISTLDYGSHPRESAGQFTVKEVVKGQGRAVYALEDRNRTVRQLNVAFGIDKGSEFSKELKGKLKEFQQKMVNEDPSWKELEARLQSKGKTLVEGLLGPMTIRALLEQGIIQANGTKGLVAVKPNSYEGANHNEKRQEPLKPIREEPKKDFADKKEDWPKQNKDEGKAKKEEKKELKETLKPKDKLEKLEQEKLKEDSTLAALKAEYDKFRTKEQGIVEEKNRALREVQSSIVNVRKEILEVNQNKEQLTKSKLLTSSLFKLPSVNEGAETCLFGLNRIDNKLAEFTSREDRLSKFKDNIEILLKQAEGSPASERSKYFRRLEAQLKLYNQDLDIYEQDIGPIRADTQKSLSNASSFIEDSKKAYNEILDNENEASLSLANNDPDAYEKYGKPLMTSWLTEDLFNADERNIVEYTFLKCFSGTSQDSVALYDLINVGGPATIIDLKGFRGSLSPSDFNRRGVEIGMRYGDNLKTFIANLQAESKVKLSDSAQDITKKNEISAYVGALKKCEGLGIDSPFRFTPSNLIKIVNERENPDLSKERLLVITATKADYNTAFLAINKVVDKFIDQGYRVQYHEIAKDKEIIDTLSLATNSKKYKADALCISGHGSQTQISLSDKDPAEGTVANSERTIDLTDKEILKEMVNYFKPGAAVLVHSCSTGQGEKGDGLTINNIANFLRGILPIAAQGGIFAPIAPGNIKDIKFENHKPVEVESHNEKGEPVKTYHANFKIKKTSSLAA